MSWLLDMRLLWAVYVMWWIKEKISYIWQMIVLLLLRLLDVVIWYVSVYWGTYWGEHWRQNWGECCSTPLIVCYWVKGGVVESDWLIGW